MTQQERYNKYKEEICKHCVTPDCESGKGIHIFSLNNTINIRCTDYVTKRKKRRKGYWLPAGFNKFKRRKT